MRYPHAWVLKSLHTYKDLKGYVHKQQCVYAWERPNLWLT